MTTIALPQAIVDMKTHTVDIDVIRTWAQSIDGWIDVIFDQHPGLGRAPYILIRAQHVTGRGSLARVTLNAKTWHAALLTAVESIACLCRAKRESRSRMKAEDNESKAAFFSAMRGVDFDSKWVGSRVRASNFNPNGYLSIDLNALSASEKVGLLLRIDEFFVRVEADKTFNNRELTRVLREKKPEIIAALIADIPKVARPARRVVGTAHGVVIRREDKKQ
jgi:hypothetical protein